MKNYRKLKVFAIITFVVLSVTMILSGCNRQIIDTTYKFNYAYVELGNGTIIEGKCDSWLDYEDSDMVQVTIDGEVYYSHSSNIVLSVQKD